MIIVMCAARLANLRSAQNSIASVALLRHLNYGAYSDILITVRVNLCAAHANAQACTQDRLQLGDNC